jgi:hypothetical protein
MSRPSIDHGILSPNGRVSKRTRKLTLERVKQQLFPEGFNAMCAPKVEQPSAKERLLCQASELRALADRGMKPRAYRRKADELEAQANQIETQQTQAARDSEEPQGSGTQGKVQG